MKKKVLDRLTNLLSLLESNHNKKIDFKDAILFSMFTLKNPYRMTVEEIIETLKDFIVNLDKSENYIINDTDSRATIMGDTKSVVLKNSLDNDEQAFLLYGAEFLIAPRYNVKGDSVIQKLMSITEPGVIAKTLFSIQMDLSEPEVVNNLEQLMRITNDDEFILYVGKMAFVVYWDYEDKTIPVFKRVSSVTGEVTDTTIDELSPFISISTE